MAIVSLPAPPWEKPLSRLEVMEDDLIERLRANGLDECDEAIIYIEALERQVKAADALIEDLLQHEGAEGFSQSTDELQAAYRATKEGGV